MNVDDDQLRTDAAEATATATEVDDYPTGSLASPTRIRL